MKPVISQTEMTKPEGDFYSDDKNTEIIQQENKHLYQTSEKK